MAIEPHSKDWFEAGIEQTTSIGPEHSPTINQRPFAWRVDKASSTTTYVGWAAIGTLDAGTTWRILRITKSGTVTSFEWEDGNNNFDNQWSTRAAGSYS